MDTNSHTPRADRLADSARGARARSACRAEAAGPAAAAGRQTASCTATPPRATTHGVPPLLPTNVQQRAAAAGGLNRRTSGSSARAARDQGRL